MPVSQKLKDKAKRRSNENYGTALSFAKGLEITKAKEQEHSSHHNITSGKKSQYA